MSPELEKQTDYARLDSGGERKLELVGPFLLIRPAEFLRHAEEVVKIPIVGTADSLNVSAAAAILLYEAIRQRYLAGTPEPERPEAGR